MSEEQLKAFIAKAKEDTSIQEQLKAAKTADDVIGIAKEHGHEFATEHITQLSEKELEGVAGGAKQSANIGECFLCILAVSYEVPA